MGFDPAQRFLRLICAGNGVLYAVQADGVLRWYRHAAWTTGGVSWSNGVGREIGTGWHRFTSVLAGADGQLFAVAGDGSVRWSRWELADPGVGDGAGSWHPGSDTVVHDGFSAYARVFGGYDGTLYGVRADGTLWWHRYLAGDGSAGAGAWAHGGAGQQIGRGFHRFPQLFAAPSGVVFGAEVAGALSWWRYLAGDGSAGADAWANGGIRIDINSGWGGDTQREWTAGADGEIYTVELDTGPVPDRDHRLHWYRLMNFRSVDEGGRSAAWAHPVGIPVGQGFTVERTAALQGYCRQQSVVAGDSVEAAVSTTFDSYTVRVRRLVPDPAIVRRARTMPGRLHGLPPGYRSAGCAWPVEFAVPVAEGRRSGVYSVELGGPDGLRHHAVFVVRAAEAVEPLLVVLPTYTYCAYNSWGGHSQYSAGQPGMRRTLTFHRPSTSAEVEPTGVVSHLLHQDLMLLRWMSARGHAFDCCVDSDVHDGGAELLGHYRGVVLCTHPEYASEAMRDALLAYAGNGGHIVYTGGNGLYERIEPSADGTALTFRRGDGSRDLYREADLPEHEVLGVDFDVASFLTFAPYQVTDPEHPFLRDTGLAAGDVFGAAAHNVAASGWETDRIPDGGTAAVFAEGLQPAGAQMCRFDFAGGGWTFAAASLCFNGALDDPVVSAVLENVLTAATADRSADGDAPVQPVVGRREVQPPRVARQRRR
jgi:N,N-dimethylformamidase